MFKQNQWPFVPIQLSEIVDPETLAVIQAGCCERLGRALTILDFDPGIGSFSNRIESVNVRQRWEPFCALLRNEEHVRGADAACLKCDLAEARVSLDEFTASGRLYRSIPCHLGLMDASYIIRVRGWPVALLYGGQHRPLEGSERVVRNVLDLGGDRYPTIKLDETTRAELISLSAQLPPMPAGFQQAFQREAEHIQRIAEAQYENGKDRWERAFLDELRDMSNFNGSANLDRLRASVQRLLGRISSFCRCDYAAFFASVQEGDTVLPPIAAVGVSPAAQRNLPHFNWRKAGLPLDTFDARAWDIAGWRFTGVANIRGDNSQQFARAACVIPIVLGSRYRGVLVLGPFAEPVDIRREQRFLVEIADTLAAFALRDLEVRYLQQERKRWRSTALLLTHQLRTALTPITTQIGRARMLAQKTGRGDASATRAVDLLRRAEDLSINLAEGARQTLEGHVLQLQPDDLVFERYSLSVLLANCLEGFIPEAEKQRRYLVIDRSVELLPEAQMDVARLTIAFSNLVDNAIKYSYVNTTIRVRASVLSVGNPDLEKAVIEVEDVGVKISEEDRERIFEQGERGRSLGRLGNISGAGLGLWEARAVIQAHHGEIGVNCEPVWIQRTQTAAHHVVFSVGIPLRQKDARGRGR